jgi:hypothetical protein
LAAFLDKLNPAVATLMRALAHPGARALPHGASLPDPDGLLAGGGSQNRYVRLPGVERIDDAPVRTLLDAAVAHADLPLAGHWQR